MERVCAEVRTSLPAYVDRSLPSIRRKLVGLHLRRCSACQAAFSTQRLHQDTQVPSTSPAVGGARPARSVALLAAGAAVGTGLGWASWASARYLRRR